MMILDQIIQKETKKQQNNQKPAHIVFDFLTRQGTFLVQDFHRPNGAKILRF